MDRLRGNDRCWCGSGRKHKKCHGDVRVLQRPPVQAGKVSPPRDVPEDIERPDYVSVGSITTPTGFQVHNPEELERMRTACRVAAEVLSVTGAAVAPGVTTEQLDAIAHTAYIERGAYPSTLHYGGSRDYPKSVCTSVNGVVCHGIPDDRPLTDGDIVNVDVTAYIGGLHGDTSATFCAGDLDEATRGLVATTREATLRGIAAVAPGEPLIRIAEAIEPFAASRGYSVVRNYGGHGIGKTFHAAPHINHCITPGDTQQFRVGMTFTVEPMLMSGVDSYRQGADGWTEHLVDSMPSAQFEHTVLVT
ncbi:MAG: type I methionyl aminopeptidase, partial [Microthrixaceae bacterium]